MANETTFTKVISLMAYQVTIAGMPGDYYLRVKTMPESLGPKDLSREVAARLNLNESLVFSVLDTTRIVVKDAVCSGYIANTGWDIIQPAARGTLSKADLAKAVDSNEVEVYPHCQATQYLRNAVKECTKELFKQPAVVGPWLTDAYAQSINEDGQVITVNPEPGKNIILTGTNIKVGGSDPSVGVSFSSVDAPQTKVAVPVADITINQPQKLVFVLPTTVTDGLWDVTVTTQLGANGRPIKTARSSTLDAPISIGDTDEPVEDGPQVQ